jgi:recombination protein RecA
VKKGHEVAIKSSQGARQIIENVAGFLTGRLARPALPAAFNFRPAAEVVTLPTGFRALDKALGVGGLPLGKITELMGAEVEASSGALLLAAGIAAKAQRKQQIVTIIDLSHQFDPWLAERCGLMAPHLLLTRPETAFAALTTLEGVAAREGLVLVVMGLVADLFSQSERTLLHTLLGRLRAIIRQSNSAFLFVTSPSEDTPFSPANYPAGFPLAEIANIRLWIQEDTWTHQHGIATAYKASLAVIKNEWAVAGAGADIRINLTR